MSRFTRQIRLAEVGEAGQARLASARVRLATSGEARAIEERYLRAAGVGLAEPPAAEPAFAAPSLGIRHPAAQVVADGAFAALVAMRAALGVES